MIRFVVLVSLLVLVSAETLGPIKGIGTPPIVGGQEIPITSVPWQVSLLYDDDLRCGGSIISLIAILTAAHCTYETTPSRWTIRAGSNKYASGGDTYKIRRMITHPEYDSYTLDYDIAVITLNYAVNIDLTKTKIIALPPPTHTVKPGVQAYVTGWGSTYMGGPISDVLIRVSVPVLDQDECIAAYQGFNNVTERMICGGVLGEAGKDACQGDSGGPFVVGPVVVGVTSWGRGCGLPDSPGVYTRVYPFVDWLKQYI